ADLNRPRNLSELLVKPAEWRVREEDRRHGREHQYDAPGRLQPQKLGQSRKGRGEGRLGRLGRRSIGPFVHAAAQAQWRKLLEQAGFRLTRATPLAGIA